MARLITLEAHRTYATSINAIKAVEKKFGAEIDGLDYIIQTTPEGRFFPVFIGERAIQRGVHFDFNVVN